MRIMCLKIIKYNITKIKKIKCWERINDSRNWIRNNNNESNKFTYFINVYLLYSTYKPYIYKLLLHMNNQDSRIPHRIPKK